LRDLALSESIILFHLWLSGSPHGTAVLAEKQVKARGTKNRQWNAQNTGNIYISFVCHRIPVVEVNHFTGYLKMCMYMYVLWAVGNFL